MGFLFGLVIVMGEIKRQFSVWGHQAQGHGKSELDSLNAQEIMLTCIFMISRLEYFIMKVINFVKYILKSDRKIYKRKREREKERAREERRGERERERERER